MDRQVIKLRIASTYKTPEDTYQIILKSSYKVTYIDKNVPNLYHVNFIVVISYKKKYCRKFSDKNREYYINILKLKEKCSNNKRNYLGR